MVKEAARRLYDEMLRSGVELYEYGPAMNHTKVLLVDGKWAVFGSTNGSTNMDTRSFGLNDEVNVAVFDAAFTSRLEQDFIDDLAHSRAVRYETWKHRGILRRIGESLGAVFERQE